ncbi:hypothetical protein O9110_004057 [Salmonella enterica]|nr:hypothetical protein [Salmonella enterica]
MTELNTLTGEKKRYRYKQDFKSLVKAIKKARWLMNEIDLAFPVTDEYEYFVKVEKSKTDFLKRSN